MSPSYSLTMRILVIHHVRNHENSSIYSSNNYSQASNTIYGAQEMDTWAGIRLLCEENEVWRLEISANHQTFQFIDNLGKVFHSGKFKLVASRISLSYLTKFFKYFDPSITQFADENLKTEVSALVSRSSIELIWSDTQFYAPIIDGTIPSVIRSVNFEPAHVLAEDSGFFKFVKFFLKLLGERKANSSVSLVPISPRDSSRYKFIGLKSVEVLPLRQLSYLTSEAKSQVPNSDYFVVMGSSFEVRHNRRNLDYCLNKLAPALYEKDPAIKILIFGTRLPANIQVPVNVQIVGFSEEYQDFLLNSLGVVVPYHGGAGMQSKVFEPLTLGVPVVANPKSIAGYPFEKDVHYLDASTISEYINRMVELKADGALRKYLSENARDTAGILFSHESFSQKTNQVLKVTAANL